MFIDFRCRNVIVVIEQTRKRGRIRFGQIKLRPRGNLYESGLVWEEEDVA